MANSTSEAFSNSGRCSSFSRSFCGADAGPGEVVGAENDVLRGHRDGLAGGGREDVVGRQHQLAALHLGLDRKRHVDGHLVTVEVRVVGGTDERVNADGLAFDELRLEGLDRKTVKRGRAVEQDRVALGDFREDVPDFGGLAVDHLLGRAHGVAVAKLLEAADDERLEQGERHLLGKTALAELEVRTDDDDGTAGVIDAFAEQVLAETAALALEHVAESDLSGRLPAPVTARPWRPLSKSASTASCSMRFSLRMMTSGVLRSRRFLRRLLRLMTRR